MRRLELLIKEVRQATTTNDINSISDFELMRYFNDGQKAIQNVIYQANSSADVFVKQYLFDLVSGQTIYSLPKDIYAQNSVASVSLLRNNIIQPLKRSEYREQEISLGYSLMGKNLILSTDPQALSAPQCLMTYNYRLPSLSLRVGKVSSVLGQVITLTTPITGFEDLFEYVSIVDAKGERILNTDSNGNKIQKDLFITNYDSMTFELTVEGDISDVTNAHYVVLGRDATSNCTLPEDCEPFLLSYVQMRVLGKISSSDIQVEGAFTAEEREAISTLFADNVKDALYPVSSDTDYMGY